MRGVFAALASRHLRGISAALIAVTLSIVAFAGPANAQTRMLTIEPNTDLVDGDVVQLSGTGFTANAGIYYCEGIVTGATPDPADCGEGFSRTTSDGDGAFSVTMTVQRFLNVANVGIIDCAQPAATCGIGAADFFSPGGEAVTAPISFTPQPPIEARIEGTVTDTNGVPVPGAPVWGYRSSDGWVGSIQTVTDASGNYVLDNAVLLVAYRITFGVPSGSDLVSTWYGGPTRESAQDVVVSPAQPTVVADGQLERGGAVTGTVTGPAGAPVSGAVVWAFRNDNSWVGSYAATTAAAGTYRIEGVAPATEVRIRFAPAAGSGLVAEWFDNSPTRSDATPLIVAAGETVDASAQLAAGP